MLTTGRSTCRLARALLTGTILTSQLLSSAQGWAQSVAAGSVTFGTQGSVTTGVQSTQNAVVNWPSLSVDAGATLRFVQPNATSAVLNRITGGDPTRILGNLEANGRVFVVNPNGVMVGPSGRIDTAGFVASTLDVADRDFMEGRLRFSGESSASLLNQGRITARSGDVVLIARRVVNDGTIEAAAGTAGLAAGDEILLVPEENGTGVLVRAGQGQVENSGVVAAAQADLVAAGGNAYALAVNNTGLVQATQVERRGGRVRLVANAGEVRHAGRIAAEGGDVAVTGDAVHLAATSVIEVSGAAGGGRVRVGGGWQGGDADLANADRTRVDAGARIEADANGRGDGGTVVVWADDETRFAGRISARGGPGGGDGGNVEVSGKARLAFEGSADLRAPLGEAGELLLDPTSITIDDEGTTEVPLAGGTYQQTTSANFSRIDKDVLQAQLALGNVTVTTRNPSATGAGDIRVAEALSWTSANTLRLEAERDVIIDRDITATSGGFEAFAARSIRTNPGNAAAVTARNAWFNLTGTGGDLDLSRVSLVTTGETRLTWGGTVGSVALGGSNNLSRLRFDAAGAISSGITVLDAGALELTGDAGSTGVVNIATGSLKLVGNARLDADTVSIATVGDIADDGLAGTDARLTARSALNLQLQTTAPALDLGRTVVTAPTLRIDGDGLTRLVLDREGSAVGTLDLLGGAGGPIRVRSDRALTVNVGASGDLALNPNELKLESRGDLTLNSGAVTASGPVSLVARAAADGSGDILGMPTITSAGDVRVEAARDLTATAVAAGGALTLQAGRNLAGTAGAALKATSARFAAGPGGSIDMNATAVETTDGTTLAYAGTGGSIRLTGANSLNRLTLEGAGSAAAALDVRTSGALTLAGDSGRAGTARVETDRSLSLGSGLSLRGGDVTLVTKGAGGIDGGRTLGTATANNEILADGKLTLVVTDTETPLALAGTRLRSAEAEVRIDGLLPYDEEENPRPVQPPPIEVNAALLNLGNPTNDFGSLTLRVVDVDPSSWLYRIGRLRVVDGVGSMVFLNAHDSFERVTLMAADSLTIRGTNMDAGGGADLSAVAGDLRLEASIGSFVASLRAGRDVLLGGDLVSAPAVPSGSFGIDVQAGRSVDAIDGRTLEVRAPRARFAAGSSGSIDLTGARVATTESTTLAYAGAGGTILLPEANRMNRLVLQGAGSTPASIDVRDAGSFSLVGASGSAGAIRVDSGASLTLRDGLALRGGTVELVASDALTDDATGAAEQVTADATLSIARNGTGGSVDLTGTQLSAGTLRLTTGLGGRLELDNAANRLGRVTIAGTGTVGTVSGLSLIDSEGALTFESNGVSFGTLDIRSAGDLAMQGPNLTAFGDIGLRSAGGSLLIDAQLAATGSGNIALAAPSGDVVVNRLVNAAGDRITIDAGRAIRGASGGRLFADTAGLRVGTGGSVALADASVETATGATLSYSGGATIEMTATGNRINRLVLEGEGAAPSVLSVRSGGNLTVVGNGGVAETARLEAGGALRLAEGLVLRAGQVTLAASEIADDGVAATERVTADKVLTLLQPSRTGSVDLSGTQISAAEVNAALGGGVLELDNAANAIEAANVTDTDETPLSPIARFRIVDAAGGLRLAADARFTNLFAQTTGNLTLAPASRLFAVGATFVAQGGAFINRSGAAASAFNNTDIYSKSPLAPTETGGIGNQSFYGISFPNTSKAAFPFGVRLYFSDPGPSVSNVTGGGGNARPDTIIVQANPVVVVTPSQIEPVVIEVALPDFRQDEISGVASHPVAKLVMRNTGLNAEEYYDVYRKACSDFGLECRSSGMTADGLLTLDRDGSDAAHMIASSRLSLRRAFEGTAGVRDEVVDARRTDFYLTAQRDQFGIPTAAKAVVDRVRARIRSFETTAGPNSPEYRGLLSAALYSELMTISQKPENQRTLAEQAFFDHSVEYVRQSRMQANREAQQRYDEWKVGEDNRRANSAGTGRLASLFDFGQAPPDSIIEQARSGIPTLNGPNTNDPDAVRRGLSAVAGLAAAGVAAGLTAAAVSSSAAAATTVASVVVPFAVRSAATVASVGLGAAAGAASGVTFAIVTAVLAGLQFNAIQNTPNWLNEERTKAMETPDLPAIFSGNNDTHKQEMFTHMFNMVNGTRYP